MSTPISNVFSQILAFSGLLSPGELLRTTMDYDGNGNMIYVGLSPFYNADMALPVWYIIQLTYTSIGGKYYMQNVTPPNAGLKFGYVWNDRTTYF